MKKLSVAAALLASTIMFAQTAQAQVARSFKIAGFLNCTAVVQVISYDTNVFGDVGYTAAGVLSAAPGGNYRQLAEIYLGNNSAIPNPEVTSILEVRTNMLSKIERASGRCSTVTVHDHDPSIFGNLYHISYDQYPNQQVVQVFTPPVVISRLK